MSQATIPFSSNISGTTDGPVLTITIDRPEARNAIDPEAAAGLLAAFQYLEEQDDLSVGILTGSGEHFCAGADLKKVSGGDGLHLSVDGPGPLGPSRMKMTKPTIAAVRGYAVAGGLELALLCDLRVVDETARFGVFCRRFGVPLIDGGTIRLPRLIGQSRAMDMILTGREVGAEEALAWGLANRLVGGDVGRAASEIAHQLSTFPQMCMRNDRTSAIEQWSLPFEGALDNEFGLGFKTIQSGETLSGATRFAQGVGRGGRFDAS